MGQPATFLGKNREMIHLYLSKGVETRRLKCGF